MEHTVIVEKVDNIRDVLKQVANSKLNLARFGTSYDPGLLGAGRGRSQRSRHFEHRLLK